MFKNPTNLLNLQNLIKRDPLSYHDEYMQQQRHFLANLHIFQLEQQQQQQHSNNHTQNNHDNNSSLNAHAASLAKTHKFHKDFGALITFLAHVSPCYPQYSQHYPQQLLNLLQKHYEVLDTTLRKTIVQALVLLQNRNMISRLVLLPVLFQLFKIQDKQLRQLLFSHIVNDIKRMNLKKVPGYLKINTQLQNYMYTLLDDKTSTSSLTGQKSLDVLIDLWRRKIWNDTKTVHIIQQTCFSKDVKMKVASLRFFLGVSFYEEEEKEEEEEEVNTLRAKMTFAKSSMKGVTKKRKKKEREIARANKKVNREDNSNSNGHSSVIDSCPALLLIHDAQQFAERLFSHLRSSNDSFQTRMLMMNVISRLIGTHQLILLNFYPFLQKYMQPHQRNVTHILTYLAQASHPLLPPDVLRPCILTLANHFVNDRSSAEVTAVGLNAIREICARAPLTMERDLLSDLIQYKKSKSKGVMMAARSIIALFRDINPTLLQRKERGKYAAEVTDEDLEYGNHIKARVDVIGADLLQQIINPMKDNMGEDNENNNNHDDEDEWDLQVHGGGSDDEDEDDDENMHTSAAEINRFLKSLDNPDKEEEENGHHDDNNNNDENNGEKKNDDKKKKNLKRKTREEEEEENGEDGEEGEDNDEEMEDGDEDEDEEGEDNDDHDEEIEDGEEIEMEDDEEGGEDDENEQGEDDGDEDSSSPSKKQKTDTTTTSSSSSSSSTTTTPPIATTSDGKALPFGATKIFTPKDFEALRQARLEAAANKQQQHHQRKGIVTVERKDKVGEIVDEDSIKGWRAKKRLSKEERLKSILTGREAGVNAKVKGGGSTNKDKLKSKPFMLVKHSSNIQLKRQRSFSQQQQAHAGHIKHMKGMGKKIKNKLKRKKSAK